MYRLSRANGEFYASVPSNVILGPNSPSSSPAPINLVGRNKVSYGEAQNENFLWLVENFSSAIAPIAPVKGQLWYDYSNDDGTGSGGELKIAPGDNVSLPNWLTVPVIAETNIEPSRSHTGRLIIYKKDRLKIRMNNSWHQIVTEVPQDKLFSALLPPRYNADDVNGSFTTSNMIKSNDYVVASFNEGGYLLSNNTIGGDEEGVLRYNSVYQWEADIIGRSAIDSSIYKIWKLKGSFYTYKYADANSDPRKLGPFDRSKITYEVINEHPGASTWDVFARDSKNVPNAGIASADKLDGDYYGLQFVGNIGNVDGLKMQWSVMYRMTGIPGSPSYK